MRRLLLILALGLALPAGAAAEPPPSGIVHPSAPPGTPLKELGYQLYAGNCSSCHGSKGEGVTVLRPASGAGDIAAAGPSLRGVGALSADFYLRTGYMPLGDPRTQPRRSRVLFSNHEIEALVAYVASLGGGPPVPKPHPERGDLAQGLHEFTSHCAGCHQIAAAGGYVTGGVAPALTDSSPVEIAQAVRIGPYLMPTFSKHAIDDQELDSIIAYVRYAKHPDDRGGWAIGRLGPVPEGLVTWWIAIAALVGTCILLGRRLKA
jgi:ubiquinol-cytochrome c reductase cytochrome c subunit